MKSPLGLEARLPVVDIVKEAAVLMWQKREYVLRLFLPVIVLMGLIDFINMVYFSPPAEEGSPVIYTKEGILAQLLVLLFAILMATTAHRFTLTDSSQWPATALHIPGKAELRYLVRGIQIGILSAFLVLVFTMVGFAFGKDIAVIMMLVGVLAASYFLARLSVTLPEIALGYKSPLSRAWAMSKGNGNSLVIVVLVLPVLLTLPLTLLAILAEGALMQLVGLAGSYLATLLSLIVLSLSYQFLLNFYEPDSPILGGNGAAAAGTMEHEDSQNAPSAGDSVPGEELGKEESGAEDPEKGAEGTEKTRSSGGSSGGFDA